MPAWARPLLETQSATLRRSHFTDKNRGFWRTSGLLTVLAGVAQNCWKPVGQAGEKERSGRWHPEAGRRRREESVAGRGRPADSSPAAGGDGASAPDGGPAGGSFSNTSQHPSNIRCDTSHRLAKKKKTPPALRPGVSVGCSQNPSTKAARERPVEGCLEKELARKN